MKNYEAQVELLYRNKKIGIAQVKVSANNTEEAREKAIERVLSDVDFAIAGTDGALMYIDVYIDGRIGTITVHSEDMTPGQAAQRAIEEISSGLCADVVAIIETKEEEW